ncbi:hypothetical protein CLOM_g5463 [Closterium sp. NIES-68]|nr:hypothetical protein CLOM_g5463 [Closterium sp. NIES-68]
MGVNSTAAAAVSAPAVSTSAVATATTSATPGRAATATAATAAAAAGTATAGAVWLLARSTSAQSLSLRSDPIRSESSRIGICSAAFPPLSSLRHASFAAQPLPPSPETTFLRTGIGGGERVHAGGARSIASLSGSPIYLSASSGSASDATSDDTSDTSLPRIKPYDALFRDSPKPLGVGPNPSVVARPKGGVYGAVLGLLGYYSKESELIRGANALYKAVTRQADDETFLRALGLPSQFRTHHALLVLHTWLALLRLRKEGKSGAAVGQTLYDTFNHDVERRVVREGVKLLVSKWMRELEKNFYGAAAAYDAAVAPGANADALPRALWRNVFAEDDSDMPPGPAAAPVQALARYVRLELASLALTDSDAVLSGNITFTNTFHAGDP